MLRTQQEKEALMRFTSFNRVEQTLKNVVEVLLQNERLKKLLYYSDPHALSMPNLTREQSLYVLENCVRITPKIGFSGDAKSYIFIGLVEFKPNLSNPSYKDYSLDIEIVCDYDYWQLTDFQLRPAAIAGEIDAMINKTKFNGLGIANFNYGKAFAADFNSGGYRLLYRVDGITGDFKKHDPEE